MKATVVGLILLSTIVGTLSSPQDRAVTKVVKMLQEMLVKSTEQDKTERALFATHKCYCDTQREEKQTTISSLAEQISSLENSLEKLKGSNGELSAEVAQLKQDIEANEQFTAEAGQLRQGENTKFTALEADLVAAIGQLELAITTLFEIGGDQTQVSGRDHGQFMAKHDGTNGPQSTLTLASTVRRVVTVASAALDAGSRRKVLALLQEAAPAAPAGSSAFTGTYVANSVQVMGILKQMKTTFENNLEAARTAEATAKAQHEQLMLVKQAEHTTMTQSRDTKTGTMATNDQQIGTDTQSLGTARSGKADAKAFIDQLEGPCATTASEYEARKLWRANEQVALSKAIAILNSDKAFDLFGKVEATSKTSFLQLASVRRHRRVGKPAVAEVLRSAAFSKKSARLAQIASLLELGNPFAVVLGEIEKMQTVIQAEEANDQKQLDWCIAERGRSGASIAARNGELTSFEGDIGTLKASIDDPVQGLKALIQESENSLEENSQSQIQETQQRKQENVEYQKDVSELEEAQELLQQAIGILKKYYKDLTEEEQKGTTGALLVQRKKAVKSPEHPNTWAGVSAGQESTTVMAQLEFIRDASKTEQTTEHDQELQAQHSYEDSMAGLKNSEANLQTGFLQQTSDLATNQQTLGEKKALHATTLADKEAVERYLNEIKPGCDFITANIDTRKAHRTEESAALTSATTMLKETPHYKAAVEKAHQERLGECQSACEPDEEHVNCKACLAKVTVPGYCAGHPDTDGC